MGFTKLDSGIVQSSIMLEDSDTFKAWIVFLAACDSDGIARVSPVYISSICHFSIEKTLEIIKKLESPDPLSRSINDDGRRIERIDGGYRIINYLKYREYTYSNSPDAVRKRNKRTQADMSGQSPDTLSSILLNSVINTEEKSVEKRKIFVPPTLSEVEKYFEENNYDKDLAARFFNGYTVAEWKDSQGRQVKNWKQKAQHVWFKGNNNPSSFGSGKTVEEMYG